MNVLFVQQIDVLGRAVILLQYLHMVILDFFGLFHDALVGAGQAFSEKPVPLAVRKGVIIEQFKLPAQVGNQCGFVVNRQVFISLAG